MAGEPIDASQAEKIRADAHNTFGLPVELYYETPELAVISIQCPNGHYADRVWDGLAAGLSRIDAVQVIRADDSHRVTATILVKPIAN